MRSIIKSLLLFGFLAPWAHGGDPQDQLYDRWEQAQRSIQSLVVDFNLEIKDRVFNDTQKKQGTFRLIRTAKGEIYGSYEQGPEKPKDTEPKFHVGLRKNTTLYWLDDNQKTEYRWKMDEGKLLRLMANYFNPLVILLDRKRAEENYRLEIKQDELYTYLSVTPKQAKQAGWLTLNIQQGQVVLMNKDSQDVPKDMPRRLWCAIGSNEFTFEVKSWRINAPDGPQVDEFTKTNDRPGWKVLEENWP